MPIIATAQVLWQCSVDCRGCEELIKSQMTDLNTQNFALVKEDYLSFMPFHDELHEKHEIQVLFP